MAAIRRSVLVWAALVAVFGATSAEAWAPYTHNEQASELIIRMNLPSARITIGPSSYSMEPAVAQAIQSYPDAFFAGSVGPDAFPDVAFGQGTIHPANSGAWVRHLLRSARLAQDPTSGYTPEERGKVLAFAYGFAVHAAGDVWGHTVANELSGDVFPSFAQILDPFNGESRAIAVRHILIESAISDATKGKDGNPDRSVAPGGYGVTSGDVSNTSTPGYPYDVPKSFIYRAMIDPAAATPVQARRGNHVKARGLLAGGFLELRDGLEAFIDRSLVNPLDEALENYDDTLAAVEAAKDDCDFDGVFDSAHDLIACPIALARIAAEFLIDSAEAFWDFAATAAIDCAVMVLDSYIAAWIDDINAGLRDWGDLSLPMTKALFDDQTLRDRQNDECKYEGGEDTILRADCEDAVSRKGLILHKANPFIADHALSMLGLPDVAGDLYGYVVDVISSFEDLLGQLGLPFNPILESIQVFQALMEEKIMLAVNALLPIDIEALDRLLKDPSRYVCVSSLPFTFPGSGQLDLIVFNNGEHDRLDQYMGIAPADHYPAGDGLPSGCGDLRDDVNFTDTTFAAHYDSLLLGEMALMPGSEVNRVFGDLLGRTISTWTADDNILGVDMDGGSWLETIDGDHAWRSDSRPVWDPDFVPHLKGGNGRFPPWESCVLRPAFKALFRDWENPWNDLLKRGPAPGTLLYRFPALKDDPSPDPVNDPYPPTSQVALSGTTFSAGGNTYVASAHALTLSVRDLPVGKAFPPEDVSVRRRVYAEMATPGPYIASHDGETFQVSGADALYYVEYASSDPCHTFPDAAERVGEPEPTNTQAIILDTTAPVTTCASPPFGLSYETDAFVTIDFGVADGALGSGVANASSTIDGHVFAAGAVSVGPGMSIDAAAYLPGVRTVLVSATDALGNAGTTPCTFEIHATTESLRANLVRAWREGRITKDGIFKALLAKLDAAQAAKDRGSFGAELNILEAFTHHLRAQWGKAVDSTTAWQLTAFAEDLIARGG